MIPSDRIIRTTVSRLPDAHAADAPFGTVLSDHMLVADYAEDQWQLPTIQPYGPLPLPPAPSAVHYGQALFEGFKAQALADGGVALFRPGDNHARFNRTAARLAMPEIPASLFVDGIADLVRTDREWVPRSPGGALYVRPVLFATDEALQVRPASHYRFVTVTSPVGPYFSGPIHLIAEERYVRAFRGGTGDVKPAGNYAPSLIAALEAQARGYHAVVWLDAVEHRWVEESGLMNIMFVVDGRVVTPSLTGTILPGITRASLLTVLADMGVNVEERPIEISEVFELAAAKRLTEAAGIGTAATVAPIGRLRWRDREIDLTPAPGGLLERARVQLDRIRTGEAADRHGWLLRI